MPKITKEKLPSLEVVWEEAQDLTSDLFDAGGDKDKTARAVASFLDAMVPLDELLPGELGEAAEKADGEFFEFVVSKLMALFEIDPEKQAERRAKRKVRQEERQQRRKERKAERKAKREKDSE